MFDTQDTFALWNLYDIEHVFNLRLVDPAVDKKFMEIVREISSQRKKNNVVKNDFLDSLIEIFRSSNESEDELNITGQCASFFINGYEASSMVRNPEK